MCDGMELRQPNTINTRPATMHNAKIPWYAALPTRVMIDCRLLAKTEGKRCTPTQIIKPAISNSTSGSFSSTPGVYLLIVRIVREGKSNQVGSFAYYGPVAVNRAAAATPINRLVQALKNEKPTDSIGTWQFTKAE